MLIALVAGGWLGLTQALTAIGVARDVFEKK
jgi:hypothetical protein